MRKDARWNIAGLLAQYRRHRAWREFVRVLTCIVVFCTTYAMILPAITLEGNRCCGKDEHTHGEGCYTVTLVCPLEEGAVHTHGEGCYESQTIRSCSLEPAEAHTHGEDCYESGTVLTCTEEEAHTHSETCRDASGALICGKEEGHTHGDGCYTMTRTLICDKKEGHTHTDACMSVQQTLVCPLDETTPHQHTDACFEKTLTCALEEHTHALICQSNPAAVETREQWEATLPQTFSGVWAEDLLAVARSQVGYAQSGENFSVAEDGKTLSGYYTRYGDWYGDPWGDWRAMFVCFCLHYAGIPQETFPRSAMVSEWVDMLSGSVEGCDFDLFREPQGYTPVPGDLVFFDTQGDGAVCHVGIVTEYTAATEASPAVLKAIEGCQEGKTVEVTHTLAEPAEDSTLTVFGYAALPEKPVEERTPLCGMEEHIHTELCTVPPTESTEIVCRLEEHTHSELCASPNPEGTGVVITCGKEEHTHSEQCTCLPPATTELLLTCGKAEHTHTEQCYVPQPRAYRYEGDAVSVTVVLPQDSQVPEDAQFRVTPITQGEEQYALLEQQAQTAAEGELRQLVLYDLSFYTQAGEYLPVEESAAVTITFKQEMLSGDQVEVIHYGEDTTPVALEGVEVQRGENQALSGLRFQTNGFSVFGVMTTRETGDNARASNDITLYPGQVYTVEEVYTNVLEYSVADVVEGDPQPYANILKTGTGTDDYGYSGERQPVGNAVYTFTLNSTTNKYTASHSTTDSTGNPKNIYFDMSTGNDARPSSETAWEFSILDKTSTPEGNWVVPDGEYRIPEGRFALSSDGPHGLFFHSTLGDPGWRLGFRVVSGLPYSYWGCNLVLFKEDASSTTGPIPGFTQVTQKSDIVSGQKYLIAGKASDEIDGDYYVVYPNLDAENRYQHAAKVSPYKLTLTGKTAGTTTVTAGKQEWNVTVNDLVSVSEGGTISIPLPSTASVASTDENIVTVGRDPKTNDVIVTGVHRGSATVTITEGIRTYTWNVTVTNPNSFKINFTHNNSPVMTFHLKDANTGEDLAVTTVPNYPGATATKYILVEEGSVPAETAPNQQYIVVPKIDGYQFAGAAYYRSWWEFDDWIPITGFVTTGYSDSEFAVNNSWTNFVFYQNGKPAPEYNLGSDVPTVEVNVNYRKLPITNTVSPSGTTINLFDYWVVSEDEGQQGDKENVDKGINKDHMLLFSTDGTHNSVHSLNQWTEDGGGVRQKIVANALGPGAIPYLSGERQAEGSNNTESLAYLFDPNYDEKSRKTYQNVGGLLQIDDKGYYYYDSAVNYAEFDQTTNQFKLYPDWAVQYKSFKGQFFPFDSYDSVTQSTDAGNYGQKKLNHFLGMTMTTRFIQMDGGFTGRNENKMPMTYEFSGDDDVWIFIDNVLVADLGGIHDPAGVNIDFSQGTVEISKVADGGGENVVTRFEDIFKDTPVQLTGNIFPDQTYHTLKFFYMERGGNASNLHLKFNLVTFPASGITKVDQVGDPIEGAKFKLYRTDDTYSMENAEFICEGTTGSNGEFVFTDTNGHPLILMDLYKGNDEGAHPYYVLEEIEVPKGYRGTGADIHLQILEGKTPGASGSAGNVTSYVMTCTNTKQSGAYASPSLQVTAPNNLHLMDGRDIVPGDPNSPGELFAVVLKYTGPEKDEKDLNALGSDDNWSPVYGSASAGYTVVDRSNRKTIQEAVREAKDHYMGNQNHFHMSSNGSYQALLEDLPGDIATYNFMVGSTYGNSDQDKQLMQKIKYIVSYYWTDTTTNTTTRVQDYTDGGSYSFSRAFGTDIQVPNMKNRIAVQKLDGVTGDPVNGASFAMYKVEDTDSGGGQHADKDYFYVADSDSTIHLYLEPDTDGDGKGQAKNCFDLNGWTGTYQMPDQKTGVIEVTLGVNSQHEGEYKISPLQVVTTKDAANNNYKENGIAEFDQKLVAGKYIIRELTAPTGYNVNPNRAMVLVTDHAIYANAGTADDDIAVSRGPGYLAGNLHYFASAGDIDNTLTWVCAQMKVSGESTKFSDIASANYGDWRWVKTTREDADRTGVTETTDVRGEALTSYLKFTGSGGSGTGETSAHFSYAADKDRPHTLSGNVALNRRLYTKIGWSYLEVLQDYAYGKDAKRTHADYANWQYLEDNTTPDDLSNLFSRSIYVHMTDDRLPGDLEITKTVVSEDANISAPEDQVFNFTVSLANSKKNVDGTYKYTVYDISGGSRTEATDADGNKRKDLDLIIENGTATTPISLKHNQAVVIQDIPAGSAYEIAEDTPPKYATTAEEKVLENGVQGWKPHDGAVVSGTMYWRVEGDTLDNLSKVDFTNTYNASANTVTLTLRKVNAQHTDAALAGAEFTLTNEGGQYHNGKAWVTVNTEAKPKLITSTLKGEIKFPLIEENGTYTLTEVKPPEGYYPLTDPITIKMANGAIESAMMGQTPLTPTGDNNLTLTVPNQCGFELPHTGGAGTIPYTVAGLLLMLSTACLLYSNKRRKEDSASS